jgi:CMP-N,N'-diacetyllegionaminic acid synthase
MNILKTVVVIPARGGSKRFPGKNLALLGGKPLLAWPIEAAKKAKHVGRVIVSTDDDAIADTARRYGAEVIMRPAELATDTSPAAVAVQHVLKALEEKERYRADYALTLQATTPLIEPGQIGAAVELAVEKNADSVVNVSEVDTLNHPYNIREVQPDGTMRFWQEEKHYSAARSERPKFYKAANLWLSSFETVMKEGKLEGKKNYPIIVPARYSSDIDTKEDLERLSALLSLKANIG